MRASGYERSDDDWYVEPSWFVDALLDVENFSGSCWDPSCGGGTIPTVLRRRGYRCHASDIMDRGFGTEVQDFFTSARRTQNVVSNPPYGELLVPYIRHALELTSRKVAIVARLAFLEGTGRQRFFEEVPLARVWVSRRRVSMPPGGTDVVARSGSIAYAWFVFEHGHAGPPSLGWIGQAARRERLPRAAAAPARRSREAAGPAATS